MNVTRYSIAGGISLAVHAAFLFVAHEPKVYAMPAGAQSTSVSINFKAAAVAPTELPKETPKAAVEKPVVEKKVTPPKPSAKPVTPPKPKKVVKKAQPIKKSEPVIHKKPIVRKKPVETPPPPKKTPPAQKIEKKKSITEPESKPQPATVNRGASAQPVMVKKPSFLSRPSAPKYPRLARKRGVEGVAIYEVWLDEEGNQVKQVLVNSSGATMLDKSALDAIKKWQFSPHSINGQQMAHRVQIPVRFKLDR